MSKELVEKLNDILGEASAVFERGSGPIYKNDPRNERFVVWEKTIGIKKSKIVIRGGYQIDAPDGFLISITMEAESELAPNKPFKGPLYLSSAGENDVKSEEEAKVFLKTLEKQLKVK